MRVAGGVTEVDDKPDLVYVLGPGGGFTEFRYSLRSVAANLGHGAVWVVGAKPDWLSDVGHIPMPNDRNRYLNATDNLLAACREAGVAESCVLMNDDFYVVNPVDSIPVLHRGSLAHFLANGRVQAQYRNGLMATWRFLADRGVEPLCYELHTPFPFRKAAMSEAIESARARVQDACYQERTLYGGLTGLGGKQILDVKDVPGRGQLGSYDFLSTSDHGFVVKPVGAFIRQRFAQPCRYERESIET